MSKQSANAQNTSRIMLTIVAAMLLVAVAFSLSGILRNKTAPVSAARPTYVANYMGDCTVLTQEKEVRGNSMTGLLSEGDKISVQMGYYSCNLPRKGDLALVHFAGDPNPLIKVIKATPGDSFSLSSEACGWKIIVNGRALENSLGEQYCVGSSGYRMLSIYVKSYKGIIPQDAYLVLGNLVQGSIDSTRFGLVGKNSLLGKAEMPN